MTEEFKCPKCSFVAATPSGLAIHEAVHKRKEAKREARRLVRAKNEPPTVCVHLSKSTVDLLIDFALEELAKRRS